MKTLIVGICFSLCLAGCSSRKAHEQDQAEMKGQVGRGKDPQTGAPYSGTIADHKVLATIEGGQMSSPEKWTVVVHLAEHPQLSFKMRFADAVKHKLASVTTAAEEGRRQAAAAGIKLETIEPWAEKAQIVKTADNVKGWKVELSCAEDPADPKSRIVESFRLIATEAPEKSRR